MLAPLSPRKRFTQASHSYFVLTVQIDRVVFGFYLNSFLDAATL